MDREREELKFQPWISLREPGDVEPDILQNPAHWLDIPNFENATIELETGEWEEDDVDELETAPQDSSLPCAETASIGRALNSIETALELLLNKDSENDAFPFPTSLEATPYSGMNGLLTCLDSILNQRACPQVLLEIRLFDDGEVRAGIYDWGHAEWRPPSSATGSGYCTPDERCENCPEADKLLGKGSHVRVYRTDDGRRVAQFVLDIRDRKSLRWPLRGKGKGIGIDNQ